MIKNSLDEIGRTLDEIELSATEIESSIVKPFSGLELPDIIRDVVDYLFPILGTYEAAFYMHFLRHSYLESGKPYFRIGTRPLQSRVVKSAYDGRPSSGKDVTAAISLPKVQSTLTALSEVGAIRKENEPNRDGTLYRVFLPEEINACNELRKSLEVSERQGESALEPDYYNIRENRLAIYERDEYKCKYCQKQLTRFTCTLDHITPVARGGDHSFDNLLTSCLECNSRKNVKPLGDFLAGGTRNN